jgi:nucleoside-diphosphate-sugar epimerase
MSGTTNKLSVFGGTGFIGSHFVSLHEERVYVEERESDIPKCDEVIYFISTTDNYNVLSDLHVDVDTNLTKLLKVLDNCKERNCTFNFVSSWFVYGEAPLPVPESSYCNPKGFYSITKRCAEQLLISFCETHHIRYRIFRLGNVYGARDTYSAKKNALQYLINELKNNRDIELYEGGDVLRDFVNVEDVCRAIMYCVDYACDDQIINIGGNCEPTPMRKLMSEAKKYIHSSSKITSREPSEFHKIVQVRDMWLDSTKLADLGFKWNHHILSDIEELCK